MSFGSGSARSVQRVTSRNAWFQKAEAVKRNRKKRWQHRLFFVEDVRSLNELRSSRRFEVEALLCAPERAPSEWARNILRDLPSAHRLELSLELMTELSDKESGPSEVQALVRIPDIDQLPPQFDAEDVILLLDRPSNPGNLGSILRSCDAFGVRHVVIFGHAVDPFDPVVVRASAGAFFQMQIWRVESREVLSSWFSTWRQRHAGAQAIGTTARSEHVLSGCDLRRPTLLLFGNETLGLSDWLKTQCEQLATLPMRGVASSLNLACAVTASLFELDRQRRAVETPALTSLSGSAK